MEGSTGSNSDATLFKLAEQAGRLFRRSTSDALGCGRLVTEAREIADHGQWLPFLRDAGIHPRTAQQYMQAARFAGDCPVKCELVSHLGIRRMLEFLRASDRAMAAWQAAREAEPDDHELIQSPPGCPLSGLKWCDNPKDRVILGEVAAHLYDIDFSTVLELVSETA